MKFSIVTACRNAARYIDETVRSVFEQPAFRSGAHELEYIVRDGGSTDGTLEALQRYEGRLQVVSKPDAGFYDALASGLQSCSGDYVAFLNAGDFLAPGALSVAADCFALGEDWITGFAVTCNDDSQVTHVAQPLRYRPGLLACGIYGSRLPFLQQPSTLWRRSLHASVDFAFLARLKYAGDAYLWRCFSTLATPAVVTAYLGNHRVHRGQISEDAQAYQHELRSFSAKPSLSDALAFWTDRLLWNMPAKLKGLSDGYVIRYDHRAGAWRKAAYGALQ